MFRREFNSKRVSGTSVAEPLSGDGKGVQGCACQLLRPPCYNAGLRVVEKSVCDGSISTGFRRLTSSPTDLRQKTPSHSKAQEKDMKKSQSNSANCSRQT